MKHDPYWCSVLPPEAERPARELPDHADVVVIGGGYTGLAAARGLARSGAEVVLLEARTLGFGASSRNGGQVLTGLKVPASALLRRFGPERAHALWRTSLAALDFVQQLVTEERIACEFARVGHIEAAAKPGHFDGLRRDRDTLASAFGHSTQLVSRDEQKGELGSARYHGLLVDETSASLQPALYAEGLAAAAGRAGALLHEHTPVSRVRRSGEGFEIETPRGRLRARDVVVATNGYTGVATPALRRRVIPVESFLIATESLGPERAARLIPRRRVVFDTRHFLHYYRLSSDDRLIFGGRVRFAPAGHGDSAASAEALRLGMVEVFPETADVRVEYAWSGNVCFTMDQLPRAGRLGGLHFALGYGGHGVAMASWLGDRVARSIAGDATPLPFSDLPFLALPLYEGRPWFLPFAGAWYRFLDWVS